MRVSPLLLMLFAGALVACGDSAGTGSTGTGSTATTGAGGGGTTGVGGSGATTGTMSTGTGMGGSTSSGPLTCPSVVSDIPVGECDIFQQDCPNANQTCAFVDNAGQTETACQTANGLIGMGQDCTDSSECQAKLFCIGGDPTATPPTPGNCTPACCPDTDEPCGPGDCNLTVSVNGTTLFFMACTYADACTLLDPASCPAGEDCHLQEAGFATCSEPSGNNVMEGGACMYVNDCGDSQNCIQSGSMPTDPSYCRYFCEAGSTAAPGLGGCPATQTCNVNFDTGFPDTGFCLP